MRSGPHPNIRLADARGIATIKRAENMPGRHLRRVENKLGALTVRKIEASDVVALIETSSLTRGESNMLLITPSPTCATVGCTANMRYVEFGRPPAPPGPK
jgi:hypothetical protein